MEHLFLNLGCALAMATYGASFFCFDRLLQIESVSHLDQWVTDGRPVGLFTLARRGWAEYGWRFAGALLSFLRLYFAWILRTPAWVRRDSSAHRFLLAARSLLFTTIVELYIIRETLI